MPDLPEYVDIDAQLRRAVFDLSTIDSDDASTGTVEDVGRRYALAVEARAAAAELVDDLELHLIDSMPGDVLTLAGVGVLTRHEQRRSEWIDRTSSPERLKADLKRAITDAIAVDPVTGEVDLIRKRVAQLTVDEVFEAVGAISNVLVAARRRHRLDMADYRTTATYYRVRLEDEGTPL